LSEDTNSLRLRPGFLEALREQTGERNGGKTELSASEVGHIVQTAAGSVDMETGLGPLEKVGGKRVISAAL